MELLSGFEPETSSLPTDWEDEVFCFPGLLCPFWSGVSSFPALLRPLLPSAHFPVWVAVWVRGPCQRHKGKNFVLEIENASPPGL